MIDKLLAALDESGLLHGDAPPLDADGIADALWLAFQIGLHGPLPRDTQSAHSPGHSPNHAANTGDRGGGTEAAGNAGADAGAKGGQGDGASGGRGGGLYAGPMGEQAPGGSPRRGIPFRAPAASALPGALRIAQALRPLNRRVPSRSARLLDEAATAEHIAERRLARIARGEDPRGAVWHPVARPAPMRRFEAVVVADLSGSMAIWYETMRELYRLLARQGAFRNVRLWSMAADDGAQLFATYGLAAQRRPRSPRELLDPAGRRLILVVSDCVADGWYTGAVAAMLDAWAAAGPVAIVQVLPEQMWQGTALGEAAAAQLRARLPGVPNSKLEAEPLWHWYGAEWPRDPERAPAPLPVIPLDPEAVLEWARVVEGAGGALTPGFVLPTSGAPPARAAAQPLSAQLRVERFRSAASPTAYRLAQLVATVTALTLPVVRLIRQCALPGATQGDVAEFFLGGLLRLAAPATHPDEAVYEFIRDEAGDVRTLLRAAAPADDREMVVRRVTAYVQTNIGQNADFKALFEVFGIEGGVPLAGDNPFAVIEQAVEAQAPEVIEEEEEDAEVKAAPRHKARKASAKQEAPPQSDGEEERRHLEELLSEHRKNVAILNKRAATYGANVPEGLRTDRREQREKVAELEAQLAALKDTPAAGTRKSPASEAPSSDSIVESTVASPSGAHPSQPVEKTQRVVIRFPAGSSGTTLRLESSTVGEYRIIYKVPYDDDALAVVIRALDAAQGNMQSFNNFELQLLQSLGLAESGSVAPDAHRIVGGTLYNGLHDMGKGVLEVVRNFSVDQNETVIYELRFPRSDISLAALPWEALWNGDQAVLLNRGTGVDSVERYIDIERHSFPVPTSRCRLLALNLQSGIPEEAREAERSARHVSWNKLRDAGTISYDEISPVTPPALSDYLRNADTRPDIVHFFGRGYYQNSQAYLEFDNGTGGTVPISVQRLAALLGDVRLLVFQASPTSTPTQVGRLLTGVAPAFTAACASAVVATQLALPTATAARFYEVFYDELLRRGSSLQQAVAEARQTLYFEETDGASWYVPTLYVRSRDAEPIYLVQPDTSS